MNKSKIVELFIVQLENQASQCSKALEEAKKDVIDAPSANQSHSDTTKYQLSQVVLRHDGRLKEMNEFVENLKNFDFSPKERVLPGCIFTVVGKEGESDNYFMSPWALSTEVEFEGKTITAITAKSPLGAAALGKETGEKIKFGKIELELIDVC